MNDSETDSITSKLGNLLLLSEHINNKMGNATFMEKKEKLKKSQLQTVKNFLGFYGQYEIWTDELIVKRTKDLAGLAYKEIWKI